MNRDIVEVQPFDSFSAVYKILSWAGYYKPVNNPASGYKRIFHQIYRHLAFMIVFIYNLLHLINVALNLHNSNKLMDVLILTIPQMNLVIKLSTLYFITSRIERLNSFLQADPTFRAMDAAGQSILKQNKETMHRLCRVMAINVTISSTVWPFSYFVRRYNDPTEGVPLFVPFATDTWTKFSLSVLMECGPVLWIGYGHISLDVLIATYYAHGQTQIKIIKQQLECFLGNEEEITCLKRYVQYKDLMDESIGKQFNQIVKRYEKLVWYINEVNSIFNFALSFQFFTSTLLVCLVIYRMTVVSVASLSFLFLVLLICIFLLQILLYCFVGNLIEFESRSVVTSLYKSDWLALSPSFRRQMLIAMIRWSQPLQPRVCYIIPLSLGTFLTIVRSSYTLYTVLVTAKLNEV